MRVLVCGSRDWNWGHAIWMRLDLLMEEHGDDLTIVHGGARGADREAGKWARRMGVAEEEHPANWSLYGRSAGPRRNEEMLDSGVDLVVAFRVEGESRGTDHMIGLARRAGITVDVVDGPAVMVLIDAFLDRFNDDGSSAA